MTEDLELKIRGGEALLEKITGKLKERGFERQATLLEDRRSRVNYMNVLMSNSPFQEEVIDSLGKDLFDDICSLAKCYGEQYRDTLSLKSRKHKRAPLKITIDHNFGKPDLEKLVELSREAADLSYKINHLIYRDARSIIKENKDTVFDIYKDDNLVYKSDEPRFFDELKTNYRMNLKSILERGEERLKRLNRYRELKTPNVIIKSEEDSLKSFITRYIEPLDVDYDNPRYPIERLDYDNSKSIDENYLKKQLNILKFITKDKYAFKASFNKFLEREKTNLRECISKYGNEKLNRYEKLRDPHAFGDLFKSLIPFDEELSIESQDIILDDVDKQTNEFDNKLVEIIMKSSLGERKQGFEQYERELGAYLQQLTGARQILDGGNVTNQDTEPISVIQNDNRYPNLKYSEKLKSDLGILVDRFADIMDCLPDISDIATSTKLRKKKDLAYEIRELPKHPLDVTFGNDSGCCVFVPKSTDEPSNGFSVPNYILNHNIRLFGVYRKEKKKEQRMGFILSFLTGNREKGYNRVLSCNSLELSRLGIAGGKNTIKKIVKYAEKWLAGYAKKHSYDAVTMGSHNYNTSVNYSEKNKEPVKESMVYGDGLVIKPNSMGFFKPRHKFHSDIFVYDKENHHLKTRPGACHYIWQRGE